MPFSASVHDPAAAARGMAAGLLGVVQLASTLAATRRPIDLYGLDDTVGQLCARVLDLPQGHGQRLLPELQRLAAELDQLCCALGMTA